MTVGGSVIVAVGICNTAATDTRLGLVRVVRAVVETVSRTIVVAVRVHHAATAYTFNRLVWIFRTVIVAVGYSIAVRIGVRVWAGIVGWGGITSTPTSATC